MPEPLLRLFVSSPTDVAPERRRTELVVERLNTEFANRVHIETIRWENHFYSAHDTFQPQIPQARDCDIVVAIFHGRLGTPLPPSFPQSPGAPPYPSGTAYEVLTAIDARKASGHLPDIYVFRRPDAPLVALDAPDRAEIESQWTRLRTFFETSFRPRTGEFTAAFHDYASTDDFARQVEACLRQFLARRGILPQGATWDRLVKSPFPEKLQPYGPDRHRVFFGRTLVTDQAIARLRETHASNSVPDRLPGRLPVLLVIGASGSGKSSLLRAALLPTLTRPGTIPEIDLWRPALLTPGADPFAELAKALLEPGALGPELATFRTQHLLAQQLATTPDLAIAPIRDALATAAAARARQAAYGEPRPARLALALDQAERLFIETPRAAPGFIALLDALVRAGLATLLLALRSDAYPLFQSSEALRALRDAGATLDLVPPGPAELEEIVTAPIAACRPPLAFEPGLAARLVADTKGGDALPLLQITLSRLYAAESSRNDGLLRATDYKGMDEAVTATADDALTPLPPDSQAALPALIAALVTDIAPDLLTNAPTPQITPFNPETFATSPARTALLNAFIDAHLLISEHHGPTTRIRPAHEALLRIWPAAITHWTGLAALIRTRHALEPLARDWAAAPTQDRPTHLDLSPALLAGAQSAQTRLDLPQRTRDFIQAATSHELEKRTRERCRTRRTLQATLAGLAAALLLAALATWQWREATVQRQEAATQRDRAQRTLTLATGTANGLVFDLAQRFRNVEGVPVAMIRQVLDQARKLQDELIAGNENLPDARRSQASALIETATTLLDQGDTAGALAAASKAQEIMQGLLKSDPGNAGWQRDLSISYNRIGDVQQAQGDSASALASYQAALAIAERLAKSDPGNAGWQRDLSISYEKIGDVQQDQGDSASALASYRSGLAIRERLAKSDPGNAGWQRDLSISYERIGDVQQAKGDSASALASYQARLTTAERLAKSDPGNAGWQRDLSISHNKIGDVQQAKGDSASALASYRSGLAIRERLAKSDPGNAGWQRDLSVSYNKIGNVQQAQGDSASALASYQAGLAIAERLAKSDPGNAGWQRDLSISYEKIGDVQQARGDSGSALASYQAGLAIRERLAKSDPGNAGWQRDLSVAYEKIGDVQQAQGDSGSALASYRSGLAIAERLAKSDPGNAGWQRDLAVSFARLGSIAFAQGDKPAAAAYFTKGREITTILIQKSPTTAILKQDLAFFDRMLAQASR